MNSVHSSAILSGDVQLGTGNTIGAFAVITGPIVLGDDNWIGTGAILGAPPEVRSWSHPRDANAPSSGNGVIVGNRNVIREYAQIHQGWKSRTSIGDDAFLMNQVYIAHDCELGDFVTMASHATLAGHVRVGSGANLGMGTMVHQGRLVSAGAMVGMGSVVTRDIPPFATAYGSPARVARANLVGMERSGVSPENIRALAAAYENGIDTAALERLGSSPELADAFRSWFSIEGRQ